MRDNYERLSGMAWQQAFADDGTGDWREHWSLDGCRGRVSNTPDGMVFAAGPVARDHGCHAVLWTRETFRGDIRIEFDYTRLDTAENFVNILYIQATGTGEGPYTHDILDWQTLRDVPYMSSYFDTMNLLHVSYAANPGVEDPGNRDYVRARRYPRRPDEPFSDTQIEPSYNDSGMFRPGVTYTMRFMKTDHVMVLRVDGDEQTRTYEWDLRRTTPVREGRVGIRHMFTRCARYRNLSISVRPGM